MYENILEVTKMSGLNNENKFSVKVLVFEIGANSAGSSSSGFPSSSGSSSSKPSCSSSSSSRPSSSKSGNAFNSSNSFRPPSSHNSSSGSNWTNALYKLGIKVGALHSAILYNDTWEIHFRDTGISIDLHNRNPEGLLDTMSLGFTNKDFNEISDIIRREFKEIFNPSTYHVITNNCHHFCDRFAKKIVGQGIPEFLTDLPRRTAGFGAGVAAFGGAIAAAIVGTPGLNVLAGVGLALVSSLRNYSRN